MAFSPFGQENPHDPGRTLVAQEARLPIRFLFRRRRRVGAEVWLPPAAVETGCRECSLSPSCGQHTAQVLDEVGLSAAPV